MRVALTLIVLFLAGCASMASTSAGEIGCPATEVQVSNRKFAGIGGYRATWSAQCRGREFVCSDTWFSGARCQELITPRNRQPPQG